MDEIGYIVIKGKIIKINIKGVFVSGDVQDNVYCQVVIVVGIGCMVVFDVECYLIEEGVI